MPITDLDLNAYADMFPLNGSAQPQGKPSFGMQETDTNIFDQVQPSTTETTTISSTTETTTVIEETDKEANIFGAPAGDQEPEKRGPGRPPKEKLPDISSYFEDRLKAGKFVAIKESMEDGSERDFIPATADEMDEVIEIQVNHRLQEREKEVEEKWYSTKSPAWKAVAKYAEMTDDPTEILPFLQGVQTINSIQNVNEDEIEGAEEIVRTAFSKSGQPKEFIDTQIEALKTTDKLIDQAKKLKPTLLKAEAQQLARLEQEKERERIENIRMVESIKQNAIQAIEAPLFGKQKLKQEEKAIIYDLIGEPNEVSGGYQIYTEIDNLFEKGDFDTLREVALLLGKKDSYHTYASMSGAEKAAEGLQKRLRVATESRTASSGNNEEQIKQAAVQRNQYNRVPRFGRG